MPRQTLILDSSQISLFWECPEKWRLRYNENIVSSNETSEAIAAGSLIHKWLEVYYKMKALGYTYDKVFEWLKTFDPDAADKSELDANKFPLSADLRALCWKRFCDYVITYAPQDFEIGVKYEAAVEIDPQTTLPVDCKKVVPLIEQGFSYKLYESSEYLFVLEGRIDFMGAANGMGLWMDHKVQMREHKLHPKSIQFRNYCLATGMYIGVINYIRLHKTVSQNTFQRCTTSFGIHEIQLWKQELIQKYVEICKDMAAGDFEHNRDSCAGKYGYPCEYTPICDEYNKLTQIEIKKNNYIARKEWKPW